MRVCHLGKYYAPAAGGMETHVRTLAQAQAALGLDVQVVCFNHQPGPTVSAHDGAVRVVRVQELGTLARLAVSPGLVAQLRAVDADVLHMHVPNPSMILAWLAARPQMPLVVTYHSDHVKQRLRSALFRPLEHRFYQHVARILATSPIYAGASTLLQAYADRVDVVPLGIDLDPYLHPSRTALDQAEAIRQQFAAPIWFGCGRLIYYKGFDVAIRALSHVQGSLLIAGNGPDLRALERIAVSAGVRERVHFLGAVPDIVPCYLAARGFWFPSIARSEAFGLVQAEAMACGCPVINTLIPHSGVAWVSPDGESGLTVPVGDERALAAAAQRLLDDPALHARFAAGARARAAGVHARAHGRARRGDLSAGAFRPPGRERSGVLMSIPAVIARTIEHPRDRDPDAPMPRREWLVTNGLGGYASSTVAGVVTRRYHGLLVASLPAPLGRVVVLNHLLERLRLPDGATLWLGDEDEVAGPNAADHRTHLVEFRLDLGLPVWRFEVGGAEIEKRILMPYGQNTVHIEYRLLRGAGPARLTLRPSLHFRSYESPVNASASLSYGVTARDNRYEVFATEDWPTLRLTMHGERVALTLDPKGHGSVPYAMEERRGYESVGSLWSPGYFRADLPVGGSATLVASTESWEMLTALQPADAHAAEMDRRRRLLAMAGRGSEHSFESELILAADQFIVTPAGRVEEAARARAAGEEVRTVIAGYHWFTDWGRDTMISLEGLTLATGRHREAGYILRTFAHYVRDGLIPNMFPDGAREGLYHTADATLWFFHAMERYVRVTGDAGTLRRLLPTFSAIVERHLAGTRFGIGVDHSDGLLRQGAEGYQLTWMDAKVDDWVVTPRRGKAVEINALWYNALRLLAGWLASEGQESGTLEAEAARVRESFNARFWNARAGYLFDLVDGESGDDPACRPNQVFAISLDHPVLDASRWRPVMETVRAKLLTPVGLRSLAPDHPDYKPKYYGDLRARDAAYHQGTVWAWLIGPFVDAWLKVHPEDRAGARRLLAGFESHLTEGCVGSISEIFDADAPFVPRGCVAQAWSVAEVLRCLAKTRSETKNAER